jgi:hypothetical protein
MTKPTVASLALVSPPTTSDSPVVRPCDRTQPPGSESG